MEADELEEHGWLSLDLDSSFFVLYFFIISSIGSWASSLSSDRSSGSPSPSVHVKENSRFKNLNTSHLQWLLVITQIELKSHSIRIMDI